jgi:tetratricopeptide (TPR) repeat protein
MMLQKQKWPARLAFIIVLIILSGQVSLSQVLPPDVPHKKYLALTEEQYQQGNYALAMQSARMYLGAPADIVYAENATDIDKARYYLAMSCLKTNEPGSKDSAINEMKATPNPVFGQRLGFALAQYYFQHNDLAKAIPLYERVSRSNLSGDEVADGQFELAYCYFNNGQFNKAEPLLVAIKELKESKYYTAGNYYYGLLAYNKNKYKEALQSFDKIKDAKEYHTVVPYYIAEIYYFTGDRNKALHYAVELTKRAERSYYDKELHLLAAQCLFEEQRYKEALPFFDFYYTHADKIRKQDLYEMAYCDYRTSEWANAIEKFKLLSSASDSLGQTAMYLLGDCYLKTGDKASARNAFSISADMKFNPGQQEASMILYGRISYETGYNDDALRQLYTLLKTFPNTQYKDEANTIISDLLIKTNNYVDAMKHLKEVARKDNDYRLVYQKATFGYAVQEFRRGEWKSAFDYFDMSLEHPVNPDYECAAYFWKGEIAYHFKKYSDVITYSQEFVNRKCNRRSIEWISPQATEQHAYVNMGYAAMASENYTAAQNYFNKAQEQKGDTYSGMVALVREADAVFMQKNFTRAILLYDKIIALDTADADYARYQKCILLGLQGKNGDKISLLLSLINRRPPSSYANFARYELAITYLETDKYPQALTYLKQLTDSISDKSFAPKSWMKRGFIYQQMNEIPQAIDAYKHVVIDYPTSEDRLSALDALKSLYIQSNQPAAYSRMLRDNNLPSADSSSIDSTYYAAAETQFSNNSWDNARVAFTNYLVQYPHGIFAIKAHYYRAESNLQLKRYKEAKEDYVMILGGTWNDFYENSARRAAGIAYEEKDYKSAYTYYLKLREGTSDEKTIALAYRGLMKSGFYTGKYQETALYADSVLATHGVADETANEATYFKARSLQHFDSSGAAIVLYKQLSANKSGEVAAELRYHIAELLFKQNQLQEAEDAANETIKLSSGYDYWIVKSYLLLADILIKEKDYFNAKATLESVVKHTKIEELKKEAAKKLEEVKGLEKKHTKLSEE